MFQTLYSTSALVVLCVVLVAAIWKGGPSEQAGAGMAAFGWMAAAAARYLLEDYALAWTLVDVLVLVGFLVLTWRSHRDWPIVAAGAQAVAVAVGLMFLLDIQIDPTLYLGALTLSTFGVLGAIAWGVFSVATGRASPAPPR